MITEDYVSFEVARLLKEKGFNKDTYTMSMYDENGEAKDVLLLKVGEEPVLRPTLQMAMKWLRDVHNIAISVYVFNRDLPLKEDNIIYTCDIATANMSSKEGHLRLVGPYEEACEEAIKYCLEKLV